jgi:hypothetical protein
MRDFLVAYVGRAARWALFVGALLLTAAFAGGYYARPHIPPPARITSAVVIGIGDRPLVVILVDDHGESNNQSYRSCLENTVCRDLLVALVKAEKVEVIQLAAVGQTT